MVVSTSEVDEWRREREGINLDNVEVDLETPAECLGYLIAGLRSLGADRDELLHDVELMIRASELDRSAIRQCRDVLKALNYGQDITALLTRLARRAKPEPVYW